MTTTRATETEDVDALIAAERLRDAAALLHERGETRRAVELLSRAAAYGEAAAMAEAAGLFSEATIAAARAGDDGGVERATSSLGAEDAALLAPRLAALGLHAAAARCHARAGDAAQAGAAWERAREPMRAADAYRAAGDDGRAAAALSSRLVERPDDGAAALALGRLLVEHGRWEHAAASLQQVRPGDAAADEARSLLASVLGRMGLARAREALGDVLDAPLPAPRESSLLFGRYEVVRVAATTPTARVVEARDRVDRARVAVKIFRTGAAGAEGRDALLRFGREARALALLRHPAVVPLLAYLPEGPAVVSPWMAGGSLAELLARGPMAPARAAEIALALLAALAEAHRIGILHRDVKPSNVLFDEAGAPHLGDFGAAHVSDGAATVTQGLIGTLAYMAPEQRAGAAADRASDLYAVGVVLHEALTGARAPHGGDAARPPSELDPRLSRAHDAAVMALLEREPGRRPADAQTAAAAIHALVWPADVAARVETDTRRTSARPPPGGRLRARATDEPDVWTDALLGRRVRIVRGDDAVLARARAFARAAERGGDALCAVYRVDPETGDAWVEAPPGRPLGARAITDAERALLARALEALHAEGAAHGAVDGEHVFVGAARGVVLAWSDVTDGSASRDRAMLDALPSTAAREADP